METDWKELIGKRCLVKRRYTWHAELIEVTVVEVSPKGRVRLKWFTGTSWDEADTYELVEVLPALAVPFMEAKKI